MFFFVVGSQNRLHLKLIHLAFESILGCRGLILPWGMGAHPVWEVEALPCVGVWKPHPVWGCGSLTVCVGVGGGRGSSCSSAVLECGW